MLHLYVRLYAYTYKVRVKNAKVGNKMKSKVVVLLPLFYFKGLKYNKLHFRATFESKVCQNPRKNTQVNKA